MSEKVLMRPTEESANGVGARKRHDPLDNLHSRLAISTGRPSAGILSDEDLADFDEDDLETALEEVSRKFAKAVRGVREKPKSALALRKLSQLALNKRLLEKRLERLKDTMPKAG